MIYDRRRASGGPASQTPSLRPGHAGWTHQDWGRPKIIARGTGAIYGVFGAGLIVLAVTLPVEQPIEGTRLLERLADRAEKVSIRPIETAREFAALTQHPHYDCSHMRCTPEIAARNAKARERLQVLVAAAPPRAPEIVTGTLPNAPILPASLHR